MRAAGIICEFNPFHNGHAYLIEKARKEFNPDGIVCVMSGNFVQRGQPAMWDKFTRARAALCGGADLVLELPVCYALNSAEAFASGGVRILEGLGCVDNLVFGSESGDIDILVSIARASAEENLEFSSKLKEYLASGLSYAQSYSKALLECIKETDELWYPQSAEEILQNPNNLLAVSYIRQIIKQSSNMKPRIVKRFEAGHDSLEVSGNFASGTYLRSIFAEAGKGNSDSIKQYIPAGALDELCGSEAWDAECDMRLLSLIKYCIMTKSSEELSAIPELSEGLENRLKESSADADDLDGLVKAIKTRRYTYSRISRALMQLILGFTKQDYSGLEASGPAYARVLAFSEKGREILRTAGKTSKIEIYTNINKNVPEDSPNSAYLALDTRATDVYNILTGRNLYSASDRVCVPRLYPADRRENI